MEILEQFFAESADGKSVRIIKWHIPIKVEALEGITETAQGSPRYKIAEGRDLNVSDDETEFSTTTGEVFRRL